MDRKHRRRWLNLFVLLVLTAAGVLVAQGRGAPAGGGAERALAAGAESLDQLAPANCRYGVTPTEPEQIPAVSQLGAGWYLTFEPYPYEGAEPPQATFVPLIWTLQDTEPGQWLDSWRSNPPLNQAFADYIASNPGRLYLVGNEVDRLGQGGMQPHVYAAAYHDIHAFIKGHDPTAQVAVSGLVQVTPMRLQYLDLVWEAYLRRYGTAMPVDVWNMHLYVLPEVEEVGGQLRPSNAGVAVGTDTNLGMRKSDGSSAACADPFDNVYCRAEHDDMQIFDRQVRSMREWMKGHGQQEKPLIISEYSILWRYRVEDGSCLKDEFGRCFDPVRVSRFMEEGFDYLTNTRSAEQGYRADDNRLVQQWMWFSLHNGVNATGGSSNLLTDDFRDLNAIGRTFRDHVAAEALYGNLVIGRVPPVQARLGPGGQTTAPLKVQFRNNGNAAITQPFEVSFYADAGLTQQIGAATVTGAVEGCATRPYEATVTWSGLREGQHDFWVVLDSQDAIQESTAGEGDNIGRGTVYVYERQVQLPLVVAH